MSNLLPERESCTMRPSMEREAVIRRRAEHFRTVPNHAARCYAEDVAWLLEQLAELREKEQQCHDELAIARMVDEGCPHHHD